MRRLLWPGANWTRASRVKVGFDGELDIICIKGGFITQLEAAEMDRIMTEATADCRKSGIDVRYKITEVSFYDFLSEYEPVLQSDGLGSANQPSETNVDSHGDTVPATESSLTVDDCDALAKDEEIARVVAAKDEELAAKDEEIASVVAAKDEELKQLRAQLERLEGVPPKRPDKAVK